LPEIPEMENYKKMLIRTIVGKPIISALVERERSINKTVSEFTAAVAGQSIDRVSRRAKYLIFHLSGGLYLLSHMMLNGRLFYGPDDSDLPGKPHVVLRFNDNNNLFFCDLRLGFVHLLTWDELEAELAGLGIEPLSSDFTWQAFAGLMERRRGVVKPLLIEQKIIAGIGNAYSNEILFAAGIMPDRTAPAIAEKELQRLWEAIPRVLQKGINNGGYIEEPYTDWDKLSGGQIPHFMVYDRGGQACKVCGTPIQESKLNGRWTYYCTICQR